MTSLASIIYETTALVGVVFFIVGTLKTLLEDNENADACRRKDSITRKKRFLLNSPNESPVLNKSSAKHTSLHKTSEEHFTIEKMYAKNLSLLQSENAQELRKEADAAIKYDPKSFISEVLDVFDNPSQIHDKARSLPKMHDSGKELDQFNTNGFEDASNLLNVDSQIHDTPVSLSCKRKIHDSAKEIDQVQVGTELLLSLIKGERANLSRQNLSEVYLGLMQGFGTISWLDLSYNQLKSLPEEFGSLEKLVHLSLKQNMLETLPDSFKNLSRLQFLDLSYNNIGELGKNTTLIQDNLIFEDMKSLESLDLSSNRLSSIPLSIGFCYNSLFSFSVDKNPLNPDNSILWRQISSLKPVNYLNISQDSNQTSRSSFDDYLSARLQGKIVTAYL
jgi:hypothetical protein